MVAISKQPHEVRLLGGKLIDWNKPPKATTRCEWTKRASNGKKVTGSFRTIAHLNRLNNLAIDKYGTGIVIIQPPYNTGVAASAGTHDFDACVDLYIPGVSWWEQQRFFRANGLGCWYRHPPKFGNHVHGFTLPPREGQVVSDDFAVHGFKVGRFVPAQLDDYYRHAFGLAGMHSSNSDKSWFPANITATIFDLNAYIAKRHSTPPRKPDPDPEPVKKPEPKLKAWNPIQNAALPCDMVDISHWQDHGPGAPLLTRGDFEKMKAAGVEVVYIKCTEGNDYVDPEYAHYHALVQEVGLIPGAYHFWKPLEGTGVQQAQHFLRHAGLKRGVSARVALDAESGKNGANVRGMSRAQWTRWIGGFTGEVVKQTGVKKHLTYTDLDMDSTFGWGLWVARYNNLNQLPHIPKGWTQWWIRQFANGEYGWPKRLPGLNMNLDLNNVVGPTSALVMPGAPPPPPPKKPDLPADVSTRLTFVDRKVLPHHSSDHNPVVETYRTTKGALIRFGQGNVQGTDKAVVSEALIDEILPQADMWVLNEVTSLELQQFVYDLPGWGKFMPGIKVANGKIGKKTDSAAVVILWREDLFAKVLAKSDVLVKGVKFRTPVRMDQRVWVQHKSTMEVVCNQGTHTPHKVDQGGVAAKVSWFGQNARAKACYAGLAKHCEEAAALVLPGLKVSAPVVGRGDLNVDFDADMAHSIKGDGTSWFPYHVLGKVAAIKQPNKGAPTHGGRKIDWFWIRQAK